MNGPIFLLWRCNSSLRLVKPLLQISSPLKKQKKSWLTSILSTGGNHFWGSQETLCSSYTHSSRSSHLDSPLLSSAFHPVKNCSLKEKYVCRSFEYTIKIFVNPKKSCLIKAQKSTPARHIDRVAPDVILGLASTNLYRHNLQQVTS